jgi:hypothetical protein
VVGSTGGAGAVVVPGALELVAGEPVGAELDPGPVVGVDADDVVRPTLVDAGAVVVGAVVVVRGAVVGARVVGCCWTGTVPVPPVGAT